MKVATWNVNGIRARCAQVQAWLARDQPDIVCLQEIKAAADQLFDVCEIDGYWTRWHGTKGYSGVAIYTKQEPVEVVYGLGIPEFDAEGRVITAVYPTFTLMNIYYPNGQGSPDRLDFKMRFYDAFLNVADGRVKDGQNLLVCGDVNTAHTEGDIARPKENSKTSGFLPTERAWMDEFLSHGYSDTLRMFDDTPGIYSYWDMKSRARDRDIGWRIDYFFVSDSFKANVTNATVLRDQLGSDHCPISIAFDT